MNIMDLANVLAPDCKVEYIGIRPGEKLHEVMVTEDDARTTVELKDRYAILPAFNFWGSDTPLLDAAEPVADGFSYTSDTNSQWLDEKTLQAFLNLSAW